MSVRPARAHGVSETSVGDDVVLFDAQTLQSFALNPTAAAVWARCDGVRTVEAIVADLADSYAAPPAQIERDVVAVLERLREQGVLSLHRGP